MGFFTFSWENCLYCGSAADSTEVLPNSSGVCHASALTTLSASQLGGGQNHILQCLEAGSSGVKYFRVHLLNTHQIRVQLPLSEFLRDLPQLLESFNTQGCATVTYPEKGNENDKNKYQGKQEFRFVSSSQNIWSPVEFKNHPYTAADVKD